MVYNVIYDSLFGNTRKIAQSIAESFGDEAVAVHSSNVKISDLSASKLLVFGTPTHGGRPSQEMQKFLASLPENSLKGVKAAVFDTSIPVQGQNFFLRLIIKFFGYAAKRLAAALKSKGAKVLAAETFFVLGKEGPLKAGETERAKEWAKTLI